MPIDHVGINVSDAGKSQEFYSKALSPLNYKKLVEIPKEYTGGKVVIGFGTSTSGHSDFWISEGVTQTPSIHLAFQAETREQVDIFYEAALKSGGKDNGKPGLRPHYHKDYYAAFVFDPDGHNIEVCCRRHFE
jgi:catechol 2,3-dioxygenase-like lactoylglutathione lyase family enzyme